jgi:hypothetical protein
MHKALGSTPSTAKKNKFNNRLGAVVLAFVPGTQETEAEGVLELRSLRPQPDPISKNKRS